MRGNSAVCQLMWDIQQSCCNTSYEQLAATGKFEEVQQRLCGTLLDSYYSGVEGKAVFDKCRSWTLQANMDMLAKYVTTNPKVVVLVRPIEDIIASFVKLSANNDIKITNHDALLEDWSEPIMRSYNGVMEAKKDKDGRFLFVDYDRFVTNTTQELARIYDFVGLSTYEHDLHNVTVAHPEDDDVYKLKGMHDVRAIVEKQATDITLPKGVLGRCKKLTKALYAGLDIGVIHEENQHELRSGV